MHNPPQGPQDETWSLELGSLEIHSDQSKCITFYPFWRAAPVKGGGAPAKGRRADTKTLRYKDPQGLSQVLGS
eukprot:3146945-Amphidinium_carterae.1